jgi:hypothetical protein
MSVNVGASPGGEGGRIVWLSSVGSGCSLSTCCACAEEVLHGLACCCPVLGDGDGLLSSKAISTLSGGEVVRLSSVRGDRTFLFTVGVNRAVCGVCSSDSGDWDLLPIGRTGVDGVGPSKVVCCGSVSCGKEGADVA